MLGKYYLASFFLLHRWFPSFCLVNSGEWQRSENWSISKHAWISWIFSMKRRKHQGCIFLLALWLHLSWFVSTAAPLRVMLSMVMLDIIPVKTYFLELHLTFSGLLICHYSSETELGISYTTLGYDKHINSSPISVICRFSLAFEEL